MVHMFRHIASDLSLTSGLLSGIIIFLYFLFIVAAELESSICSEIEDSDKVSKLSILIAKLYYISA